MTAPPTATAPSEPAARGGGSHAARSFAGTNPADVGSGAEALADVASITAVVARVNARVTGAASWSGAERREMLDGLDRAMDGLAVARAAVLVAERDAGSWQGAGDRSFAAWRARTGRAGERSAGAQVRQAEGLATIPTVAGAVADGRICFEHAAVIARLARTGSPGQQHAVSSPSGQDHLLGMAESVDAGTFAVAAARWAATVDPDALEADHQAQRRERYLHLADTPRGTFVKGRLDITAGHRLRLALEALTPRPAADDDRDQGQRHADALDTMASRVLADPDTKPGGHVPPQVSLLLSEETWLAARAHRDRRRAVERLAGSRAGNADRASGDGDTGAPDAGPAGDQGRDDGTSITGYPPATLEDGAPVPPSELARVLCDCAVTRIAIDADGVPLDLGRTQRLFTGEQRRAIIARDRECIWPGCHMPARWSEIHHLRWWERDAGPTSADNGGLMCTFHHHESHRRDLSITRVTRPRCDDSSPRTGAPRTGLGRRLARRRGASSEIALVDFEIRDPAGRLVEESVPRQVRPGGPDGPQGARTGAPPGTRDDAPRAAAMSAPPSARPEPPEAAATSAPPGAGDEAPRAGGMPAQPGGCRQAPGVTVDCSPDTGGSRAAGSRAPRGVPGGRVEVSGSAVDQPELEWTTDPVTGMRIPTLFLTD